MCNQPQAYAAVSLQRAKPGVVILIKIGEFFTLTCVIAGPLGWIISIVDVGIGIFSILNYFNVL